jgi:signal transduction protein with GAF and PtsI domain
VFRAAIAAEHPAQLRPRAAQVTRRVSGELRAIAIGSVELKKMPRMDRLSARPTRRPEGSAKAVANDPKEQARLAEIELLQLVDTLPPNDALQAMLGQTARKFGTSVALITIVTRDRQFFKAYHGIDGELLEKRGTSREVSFCRHVVESDEHVPLVVADASASPTFADNPLVVSGVVGSYVGAPLITPSGHVLGTLCLIDQGPWLGSAAQVHALTETAKTIATALLDLADAKTGRKPRGKKK